MPDLVMESLNSDNGLGTSVCLGVGVTVAVGMADGVFDGAGDIDGFTAGVVLGVAVGAGLADFEKMAVADCADSIFTVHVICMPLQAPDQPSNRDPGWTDAVRITDVPVWNFAES